MIRLQLPSERATADWSRLIQLFLLCGAISGPLAVLMITIDGFLRPGYSPIHQVVSDLGIGENAWILNTDLVVFGLLFMLFAIGFYQAMLKSIGGRKLIASTLLLLLTGAGAVNDGFFAEYNPADPNSAFRDILHSLGLLIGLVSLLNALFMIGLHLRKDRAWRRYGWYSILTSLVTLLLLLLPYALPQYGAQLGGLNERMLLVVAFAWHVVTGCRLFALEGPQ